MSKLAWKFGRTSNTVRVFIQDSSVTTGAGLTGVTYASSGLVIDLIANNSNTAYHYKSAATATIEDITTIGTFAAPSGSNCRFKAVDATNFPGLYEIQFLDGLFDDSGATSVIIRVAGVTNMVPTFAEIQLVAYDPDDAAGLGLSRLDAAVTTRLAPTVAGRTLDVSATGEAGVDLANVGSPTTTLVLSGTTIKTATDVETATADIQSRIPAALVGGRMDASIGAVAAGVIAAASFASGALDAVWNTTARTLTSYGSLVADTAAAAATAVWGSLVRTLTAATNITTDGAAAPSSTDFTASVAARIDAAVSSRLAAASYSAPPSAASIRAEIDASSVGLAAIYARTDVATSSRLASAGYTAPLDSTATQAAAAAALTAYDPPTRTEATADKNAVIAAVPTAAQNAAAILAAGDVDGYSLEQTLKLCLAVLVGKLSGAATTTITIRAADDSKARIMATVDADGNRSAVTLDAVG